VALAFLFESIRDVTERRAVKEALRQAMTNWKFRVGERTDELHAQEQFSARL